jgi:hypothetical protein
MTPLLFLNKVILQWFTLRLARIMSNNKQTGWHLMHGVVPTTGWNRTGEPQSVAENYNDFKFMSNKLYAKYKPI